MEKIRTANFTGRIWKTGGGAVITVPSKEIRAGKFKIGQMVETTIQTIG